MLSINLVISLLLVTIGMTHFYAFQPSHLLFVLLIAVSGLLIISLLLGVSVQLFQWPSILLPPHLRRRWTRGRVPEEVADFFRTVGPDYPEDEAFEAWFGDLYKMVFLSGEYALAIWEAGPRPREPFPSSAALQHLREQLASLRSSPSLTSSIELEIEMYLDDFGAVCERILSTEFPPDMAGRIPAGRDSSQVGDQ